jgi:predicted metalloprotease with PDZ domain
MRLFFLCLLSVPLLGSAAAPSPTPVRYSLTPELSEGAITALKVEVRFRADPTGTTDFRWQDGWAGERRLWQWARDFRVAGATAVEANGDGQWRIQAAPGAELTATYRIVSAYDHDPTIEDTDQPKPVIRPRWFYAVGNALFGYPANRENAPAAFHWSGAPSGIGFASDLEHLAGPGREASRPGTVADALESIVIGGRDLRTFPSRDGSGVRVAVVGGYAFTPEELDSLARQVIGMERDFWRADRRAPFLVTAAPIVASPAAMSFGGTGRGDGFALWIDQRVPLDRMKWLLAHEYFHTWNAAQLGTMPEDRATRPAHYWFSEGFTDYYARALMVRAGLISPEEFAEQWNEMLAAYAGSPVRNMAGARVAAEFWNNEAVQKLPYQLGAMLAAMWNARLLATSRGRSNLDSLLKSQLSAARSSRQEATQLFRSLAARQGLDTRADEASYLARGETIMLPPNAFGPCATVVTERRPTFSRGFDAGATASAGNIVAGVDPALPAYAAGLRDGMKILARTEGETDNALVPYALLVEDQGQQRTIRYLPQGHGSVAVQQIRLATVASPTCRFTLGGTVPPRGTRTPS